MRSLTLFGNILKQNLGKNNQVKEDFFKLGQLVNVEVSPFILLVGSQARYQDVLAFSGTGHIMAVTEIFNNTQKFFRIQFSNDQYIIACVDERAGKITECYWFKKLDSVQLTTGNYNDFLGDENGMIGWWQFQTLDGVAYNRYWQPWDPSVPVRVKPERFTATSVGNPVLSSNPIGVMMYWRATERINEVAPLQEYLWVEHHDARNQQRVDIYCGYDIDPSMISIM